MPYDVQAQWTAGIDETILALQNQIAQLEAELAELKHPADEPETGAPPDELWLQWFGDDEGHYLWPDDVDRAGVTWSSYQVWPRDVRYVRAEAEAGKMTDQPDDANGRAFLTDIVMGRILTFRSRLAQLEWLCGQEDVTAERLEDAGALLRRQIAEFDSLGDAYRAASD